jgi:nucleoside 2-deoxyribosyltransferase
MDVRQVYFAGELFDHKHLTGNALLAEWIARASEGRYRCILPQDLEQIATRAVQVRDQDLRSVLQADVALFNFDGPDLDSGTVVEFVLAKMLDIPSVILRTDFRAAGDQRTDGDPWNLMCSGYPRTRTIITNGMALYQEAVRSDRSLSEALAEVYGSLASRIVSAFDVVTASPPTLRGSRARLRTIVEWAVEFSGMETPESREAFVDALLERKLAMGMLTLEGE